MIIVQSVLNSLKNINPIIRTYILGLLLSSGRKNCAAIAHSTGLPQKMLYAFLSEAKTYTQEIEERLLAIAKETRKENVLRALIVDPTTLIKHYAKTMQKICYDRSGCTKHVERCLVPVYVAIADQNITIPLNLEFWVQEKITGKRRYKSKVKITQELIDHVIKKAVSFDFISLDGAYAALKMFKFFQQNKSLKFIMRIPRNRVIKLANGTEVQLQQCPSLKLKRNERAKTIEAELYGSKYFFTAQKRKKRDCVGWETVFLVSNMDLSAKDQIAAYDLRWPVEKMNRTTKQKFGTAQCQAVEASKQHAHIMAAFLTYSIIGLLKIDNKSQNVDGLVNIIRDFHFDDLVNDIKRPKLIQRPLNIDPIVKLPQILPQNPLQNCDLIKDLMC
jgi:hypothetical protein